MLAYDWVVLLQLDALAGVDFVLTRYVDVAGVGGATKLDDGALIFTFCGHGVILRLSVRLRGCRRLLARYPTCRWCEDLWN